MSDRGIGRRQFLRATGSAIGGGHLAHGMWGVRTFGQAPGLIRSDSERPSIRQGVQSGDVLGDRAIVWSRTDRPARMLVEYDTTNRFANPRTVRGPYALPVSDFTAKLDLVGLPAAQDILYRVRFEDLNSSRAVSEAVVGRFRTAPSDGRDIRFVWSADTCGQGFGINTDWGGMKSYEAMRRVEPDFFIHSGDTIYADGPIPSELVVENGRVWRNLVTEAKSKVAQTLDDFRGAYLYNLLDDNVRRFNADVPQVWQWDDHEVLNNWSPSTDLSRDPRFTEKSVELLAARASRAFLEYAPMRWHTPDEAERVYRKIPYGPLLDVFVLDMRSYRGPNSFNRQPTLDDSSAFLGRAQVEWLTRELQQSRATWKVIAADMPIGRPVPDGQDEQGRPKFDAIANGDGPPLGRELEVAEVLRAIKRNRLRNIIWLTGDVHYTAAHYYDPAKARFGDFDAFWEFVSGPIHAGGTSTGPLPPDDTFGLDVVFQRWAGVTTASPFMGALFFGEVSIDAKTRILTVRLKDLDNVTHFTKTIEPIDMVTG